MNELLNILNEIFKKYGVSEEEVSAVQEAIANVEGNGDKEFKYETEETDISEEPEDEE